MYLRLIPTSIKQTLGTRYAVCVVALPFGIKPKKTRPNIIYCQNVRQFII